MSRFFGPVFQAAYVVPELQSALAHWTETLGIGPFFLYPTPLPFEWLEVRGRRTDRWDVARHIALSYSGDTMIEIIVPGADPSPYREFLEAGRSGLHHLGTIAEDYDAQMALARAAGVEVALEGRLHNARYAYFETDGIHCGTMIEMIELSNRKRDMFDTIKAASRDWDGREPLRSVRPGSR